ncbi:MAG: secretin N-terminal domain-containing protein [Phycisphaeraceae bacterium]
MLCLTAALPGRSLAQDAPETPDAQAADEQMIRLSLPENVPLKTLTDFVGARLKLNIVYDQALASPHVTLKTPNEMPASALRDLLENMLKINGMVLVEQPGVPGLLRVTTAEALGQVAGAPLDAGAPLPEGGGAQVVSKMYKLEHIGPDRAAKTLEGFVSKGASVLKLPRHDMIIVTDYKSNLERLERMLALADQPGLKIEVRFVEVQHLSAQKLVTQVEALIGAQASIRGEAKAEGASVRQVVLADARTNQVIIAARPEEVAQIEQIIASLDVSLGLVTKVYRLNVVKPDHVDEVAVELIGEDKASRLYKSVTDEETGLFAVTTTPEIHEQLQALIETMDKPVPEAQSPIRFYKLQNASALTVAETLNGIGGEGGLKAVTIDGIGSGSLADYKTEDLSTPGPSGSRTGGPASDNGPLAGGALPDTRVLAYEPMNTVIVVAPPSLQPIYENLIKRLDERRPQVLIEATVVALDTTDEFSLGVEFSKTDSSDGGTLLNFSQFGLSTADPSTGALTLNPGVGFNGALLSADIAEIVIQALQRDTNSRVLTRPSVLVNDNAEGKLQSLDSEPYESVNANTQVATTTYAGDLEAGTDIVVKPSISDGDFLKLDYEINISSFVGERTVTSGGGTLPPARTENNIKSSVTIPDGHTIVVGGLTREIDSETIQRIPLLGQIPIVEYAFSQRNTTKRQITVFVFLRPVILRDDKFADLKLLSGGAAGHAKLPADFPTSLPIEVR